MLARERSRHWLLLLLMALVLGLTLLFGIVAYNRTARDTQLIHRRGSSLSQRVFQAAPEDVVRVRLEADGIEVLQLTRSRGPDAPEGAWETEAGEETAVDHIKLSRFVGQLLQLRFEGNLSVGEQPNFTAYGLDYPTYRLQLETRNGASETLLVGSRLPGSTLRYAFYRGQGVRTATLNDPLGLLHTRKSDFFRSDFFALNGHPTAFTYTLNTRKLSLSFIRTDGSWALESPAIWPAKQSEVEAVLTNLLYLSVNAYYPLNRLSARGVDVYNPLATLLLESAQERFSCAIYADKLGNYYARKLGSSWAALLPKSFRLILEQPVGRLLASIPPLPDWGEVETLSFNGAAFARTAAGWQRVGPDGKGRDLAPEGAHALEVWYNNLNHAALISTRYLTEDAIRSNAGYSQVDCLQIRSRDGSQVRLEWRKVSEETGVLQVDGRNTGFEIRLPGPLSLQKEG